MKITAFAATSSRKSINAQLAQLAANQVSGAEVELLDLNDYEMPMFSEDKEAEVGQPQQAKDFLAKLASSDAIVVSFAEHNGSYTVAYKNLLDWSTRVDRNVFQNKPVVFLAASPGPGGAVSVLNTAVNSAGFFAADVKGSLSIADFYDVFDMENQTLKDPDLLAKLRDVMQGL